MRAGYAMLHTAVPKMTILTGLGTYFKARQHNKKHTRAPRDKAIWYAKSWLDEGRICVLQVLNLKFPQEECRCMCTHSSLELYSPGTQRSQCSDTNRPSMSRLAAFPQQCKFSAIDSPILLVWGMLMFMWNRPFSLTFGTILRKLWGAALTQ